MKKWAEWLFGEKRQVSALVFPCMASLVLTVFISRAVLETQPVYGTRMMVSAIVITLVWIGLLALDSRRILKGGTRRALRCSPVTALALSVLLGIFAAHAVWGNGYLNLVPLERIDNGKQHLDSIYQSALAESFRRSIVPSTLLNNEPYIPYHTFVPFVISLLSRLLGVPALVTYSYIYPVLFIPMYLLAQIMAISAVKEYFGSDNSVRLRHLALMIAFNVGFLYTPWLGAHGIWKRNYIASESFLIANIMMFLSYAVIFRVMKEAKDGKDPEKAAKRKNLVVFLLIPAAIFLITWSKVSVGLLFAASVMYYVFRMHFREIRLWGINVLYGAVLLAGLWLFSLSGSMFLPSQNGKGYLIGAYKAYCPGPLGLKGHYAILLVIPAVFVILEIFRLRKEKRIFAEGKTVWIEDLVLFAIAAFLPGFLIDIDGGSGAYFSCVLEIPAMLLLCGQPIFNREIRTDSLPKKAGCFVCAAACAAMCWINKSPDPMRYVTGEHKSNLSEMLLEVRDKYGAHPDEYTVYLDKDNIMLQVFDPVYRVELQTAYLWPAMTGIGVINGTYRSGSRIYTYTGTDITNYGSEYTVYDHALTLEEAMEEARKMGKKGVIHVTADGYEFLGELQ